MAKHDETTPGKRSDTHTFGSGPRKKVKGHNTLGSLAMDTNLRNNSDEIHMLDMAHMDKGSNASEAHHAQANHKPAESLEHLQGVGDG